MYKLIITGNLGKDPELRQTQSGEDYALFTVGVKASKDKTQWVDCVCYKAVSKVAMDYLKKGSKVLLEGTPAVKAYINKNNEAVATLSLSVATLEMLSSNKQDETVPF